jgi:hypothetical protein
MVFVATVIQVAPMALGRAPVPAKPRPKPEIEKDGGPIAQHNNEEKEEQMDRCVKEFFLQYERANSASDTSTIGGLYADTFMFGGPHGVHAVKKKDFLKIVPKMKAHFSSMGLCETRLQTVKANPLDSRYLLATVGWRIKFRNSSTKPVDATATYVLMLGQGNTLSIVFQIDHQDLASVIKDQQSS